MKLKQIITMCALAAAVVGAGSLYAQDNGGGGPGGPGGGRGFRMDPAQMQQQMLDRVQEELGFTNETDWAAVKPLVQKVFDSRRDIGFGGMGRMMFGRQRGGDQGGRQRGGPFGGEANPAQEALQKAVDDNAPAGQIKDLLTKYQDSQKAKQAKLAAAQADLRAVLTVKQEATATLLGLLN